MKFLKARINGAFVTAGTQTQPMKFKRGSNDSEEESDEASELEEDEEEAQWFHRAKPHGISKTPNRRANVGRNSFS